VRVQTLLAREPGDLAIDRVHHRLRLLAFPRTGGCCRTVARSAVAEVIGVSRSNLIERMRERPKKRLAGRRCQTTNSWQRSKALMAELPTYGYRRAHRRRCAQPPLVLRWL
jgi:hypothetical protein